MGHHGNSSASKFKSYVYVLMSPALFAALGSFFFRHSFPSSSASTLWFSPPFKPSSSLLLCSSSSALPPNAGLPQGSVRIPLHTSPAMVSPWISFDSRTRHLPKWLPTIYLWPESLPGCLTWVPHCFTSTLKSCRYLRLNKHDQSETSDLTPPTRFPQNPTPLFQDNGPLVKTRSDSRYSSFPRPTQPVSLNRGEPRQAPMTRNPVAI